jgi:predicted transcriptional regulator
VEHLLQCSENQKCWYKNCEEKQYYPSITPCIGEREISDYSKDEIWETLQRILGGLEEKEYIKRLECESDECEGDWREKEIYRLTSKGEVILKRASQDGGLLNVVGLLGLGKTAKGRSEHEMYFDFLRAVKDLREYFMGRLSGEYFAKRLYGAKLSRIKNASRLSDEPFKRIFNLVLKSGDVEENEYFHGKRAKGRFYNLTPKGEGILHGYKTNPSPSSAREVESESFKNS